MSEPAPNLQPYKLPTRWWSGCAFAVQNPALRCGSLLRGSSAGRPTCEGQCSSQDRPGSAPPCTPHARCPFGLLDRCPFDLLDRAAACLHRAAACLHRALVLGCAAFLLAPAAHPQQPIPIRRVPPAQPADASANTLSVHVRLVSLFVNVTDTNGAPVPNLTRDNFTLTEDGRNQPIAIFEKQSGVPLSLVLAIDTSGSTHKDSSVEQHAAHDFVHALLRPVDQLALLEFNSDVREVVPFTNSVRSIDQGLGSLGHGPATAFFEAVYLASQNLHPRSGRKVLVLISDGGNTVAGTTYQQALEQAERGEVMIYSIIDVPIEADAGRDTGGEHAMITLSEQTGGKYFYADSAHLAEAFRKISDDLRTQYLLAYYPRTVYSDESTQRDAFHAIAVTLSGTPPDAHYSALYRTGYYRPVAP